MILVHEWFPTGKFRNVGKPFRKDYTYEKELMAALPLTEKFINKAESETIGNFGQNLVNNVSNNLTGNTLSLTQKCNIL